MPETSWTQIHAAAAGDAARRAEFACRYAPVVTAYLRARWPDARLRQEVDDAVQEVFVDCFRANGALSRVDASRATGFRTFLLGVTRIVAQRAERRRIRSPESRDGDLDGVVDDERTLSRAFDRAWAMQLAKETVRRNRERALSAGPEDLRRVEILRLRFSEGLPIREIAPRIGLSTVRAHREYARARSEFRRMLIEVVAEATDGDLQAAESLCEKLLDLLD